MRGMNAALGQDVDPEAVQLQLLSTQIKGQILGKRRDMFVYRFLESLENRKAPRQIGEGGIRGVAGIAVVLRPLLPCFVTFSNGIAGCLHFSRVNGGAVIGKGGENIKRIRSEVGFYLYLSLNRIFVFNPTPTYEYKYC